VSEVEWVMIEASGADGLFRLLTEKENNFQILIDEMEKLRTHLGESHPDLHNYDNNIGGMK